MKIAAVIAVLFAFTSAFLGYQLSNERARVKESRSLFAE
jgi:hypothetical protein